MFQTQQLERHVQELQAELVQQKDILEKKERTMERLQLDLTNSREEFNNTADEVRSVNSLEIILQGKCDTIDIKIN